MTNNALDIKYAFDTELSISAASFNGSAQLIGTLTNVPAMIIFANQTNQSVFLADNNGSTKGKTLQAGEEIILDCTANSGNQRVRGFQIGTSFYATAPLGTGNFKIAVIYSF